MEKRLKFIQYHGYLPPNVDKALTKYLEEKYGKAGGHRSPAITELIIKHLKKEKYL